MRPPPRRPRLILPALGLVAALAAAVPARSASNTASPRTQAPTAQGFQTAASIRLPARAVFYYPWFPENWSKGPGFPFSNYVPSLGYYDLGNLSTARAHVNDMRYARIDTGILSWWGQGTPTDSRVPTLLEAAAGTRVTWAIHYEQEGYGDPTVEDIIADLSYLQDNYTGDPAYARVRGRPVVFVFTRTPDADTCEMAGRWTEANETFNFYLVLRLIPDASTCLAQPNGWYDYKSARAEFDLRPFQFSISPGFWKKGDAPLLSRDPGRWRRSIRHMISSCARWQLIISYNEWGEGTSVESAQEWASPSGHGVYVDALRHVRIRNRPNHPLRRCERRGQT